MLKILGKKFFNGDTLKIARALIGANLCRRIGKKIIILPITEVEAYDGPRDKASHASRGKTPRNFPMFESGGIWYVYLVYGNHWMLNIVTGKKDYPAAILIRGAGLKLAEGKFARSIRRKRIDLGNIKGPGRLTKFMRIGKKINGKLATQKTGLWIEKGFQGLTLKSEKGQTLKIKRTPRIGVNYAGPIWSKKLYRFILQKNPASGKPTELNYNSKGGE